MKRLLIVAAAMVLMMFATTAMAASNANLTVTAEVTGTCMITGTSAVNFVLDPSSGAPGTASGGVTVWCTNGTTGTLSIGAGTNDSGGGDKYMVSVSQSTESIRYSLSLPLATYVGQGAGTTATLAVDGSVAFADYQDAMALNDYEDTVTVSINP